MCLHIVLNQNKYCEEKMGMYFIKILIQRCRKLRERVKELLYILIRC